MSIFKRLLLAISVMAMANSAYAADVGVSISIGQPGFYGRLDIGDYPYPQPYLINPAPIIVHRPAMVVYEPIYLHVPPGHAKRWSRYCGRYDACDRPVYFVRDRWYNDVFIPQYRERHGYHDGDQDRGYNRDRGDKGRGDKKQKHGKGHGRN